MSALILMLNVTCTLAREKMKFRPLSSIEHGEKLRGAGQCDAGAVSGYDRTGKRWGEVMQLWGCLLQHLHRRAEVKTISDVWTG